MGGQVKGWFKEEGVATEHNAGNKSFKKKAKQLTCENGSISSKFKREWEERN